MANINISTNDILQYIIILLHIKLKKFNVNIINRTKINDKILNDLFIHSITISV
jgi:hypothetical protein